MGGFSAPPAKTGYFGGEEILNIISEIAMAESVQTDDTGWYVFPSLAAGTNTRIMERAGFRRSEKKGVVLDASAQRAIDLRLEIGAGTSVNVVSENRAFKS